IAIRLIQQQWRSGVRAMESGERAGHWPRRSGFLRARRSRAAVSVRPGTTRRPIQGAESGVLSTPFHKYDHVCGEGFLAQTRRERRAYPSEGSVRSEQRRLGRKEPPPGGLRRFSVLALLLLGHSPTSGDAPSSRLARTENRRNQRARIYET